MSNPCRELAYEVYLTTEHWRKVRAKKIDSVNGECEKCGRRDGLEVHHLTYERVGEEAMEDLQALCPICHREAHGRLPTAEDWARARWVSGAETRRLRRKGAN